MGRRNKRSLVLAAGFFLLCATVLWPLDSSVYDSKYRWFMRNSTPNYRLVTQQFLAIALLTAGGYFLAGAFEDDR